MRGVVWSLLEDELEVSVLEPELEVLLGVELELELDGVLLEVDGVLLDVDGVLLVLELPVADVEPLAEPAALMLPELEEVSVELAGVALVLVLMSELWRVVLLQPPKLKANAASAAAPVILIFCVFILTPQGCYCLNVMPPERTGGGAA